MTQAQKAQLRYIALMTQITEVQGDLGRTLTSPANALRVLQQQFTLLGREIGNVFIPLLNAIIPVAVAVVRVLTKVIHAIALLVGYELPELNWDSVSSVSGGIAEDLDDANGSAKALKRQLAGFDELNNLTTPSSGGGAGNVAGGDLGIDLPQYDMLKGYTKGIDDLTDKVMRFFGLTEDESGKLSWHFTDMDGRAKLLALTLGGLVAIKLGAHFANITKDVMEIVGAFGKIASGGSKLAGVLTTLGSGSLATGLLVVAGALLEIGSMLHFVKENWDELKVGFSNFIQDSGLQEKLDNINITFGEIKTKLDPLIEKMGGLNNIISKTFEIIGGGFFATIVLPTILATVGMLDSLITGLTGISETLEGIVALNPEKIFSGMAKGLESALGITFIKDFGLGIAEFLDVTVFKGKLQELKTSLSTWFEEIKVSVPEKLSEIWEEIKTSASTTWDSIKTSASEKLEGIATWFNETVAQPIKQFFQPIIDFFGAGFKIIGELAEGCWNTIVLVWDIATGWFEENVTNPVKQKFDDLFSSVGNWASEKWNKVKEIWGVAKNWFADNVSNPVKEKFDGAWDNLKSGASTAYETIKSVFSPIANWFRDKFTEAWTNVKNVFSTGGRIFDNIKQGIASVFTNVLNHIISGLNNVISTPFNTLNGILDRIQGISIAGVQPFSGLYTRLPVPQIPQINGYYTGGQPASGEMFMARENGIPELVGRIGNKATVANNEQIIEGIKQGVYEGVSSANESSSSTPIYNVVNIGNRQVYRGVGASIRNENNRYGRNVVTV